MLSCHFLNILYGFCINRNFVAGLVFYGGLQAARALGARCDQADVVAFSSKERPSSVRYSCDHSDVVASNSKTFCIQREDNIKLHGSSHFCVTTVL